MIKIILIFIGLKLLELTGVLLVFALALVWIYYASNNTTVMWFSVVIVVISISPLVYDGLRELVISNWRRAKRIANK